jgi:5-enolpyruvylshikimate-3-phosphate synthase
MQELDELRASYESLKVDHKKLQKSHTKLKEAHSSLVEKCENMPINIEKAKTCNIGISCDIIDEFVISLLLLLPLTLHVAHLHHPHLVVTVSLMTSH